MASTINVAAFSDALVVLGTAGIVVPIVSRLGFSPVLAYLGAGALLGPLGLGSLINSFPALFWFTVGDAKDVAGIAELGIVFLLFLIGLELSLHRLLTMRRLVFGLGGLQVLITTALLAGGAVYFGKSPSEAIILGGSLSLSSTAIVLELLSRQERLTTNVGRASFAVLLLQDLAVIPILMFISLLAAGPSGSVLASLGRALLQAALALAVIVVFGRVLLRPLFRMVAATRSRDLFIATTLFVIIAAGVIANQAGLSMALGAFVAGLLLAETEYRKAIEATIEPFKGLLLGIFFFTVGMDIDVRELLREPLLLAAAVVGLIAVKSLLIVGLARLFRLSWPVAIEMGFVTRSRRRIRVCRHRCGGRGRLDRRAPRDFCARRHLGDHGADAAIIIRGAAFRFAPAGGRRRTVGADGAAERRPKTRDRRRLRPRRQEWYVRSSKSTASLIAANFDGRTVTRDRREGHDVYYGDAADPKFLEVCGLANAAGVIITIHDRDLIDSVVEHVRAMRSDVIIVSRARDANHARHLYQLGATDAVPETVEASLQLAEAALVGLGVPPGPVIASLHEKRDELRRTLQQAAREAGLDKIHPVKTPRLRRRT